MPRKKKAIQRTLINYIIDESGSMQTVADKVRQGFNEYKQEVEKNTDGELLFTVTKFNTEVIPLYTAAAISEVSDLDLLTYRPDGMTALYDALGKTIRAVQDAVDKNTRVITVIMTDGMENSSHEFDSDAIASLIEEREKEGNWTFVFLGADQDAWAQAQSLGFRGGNVMSYASAGTGHAHSNLAAATVTATASASPSTTSFFRDAGQSADDYNTPDEPEDKNVS